MGSGGMFFALDFDGEVRDALRSLADVMLQPALQQIMHSLFQGHTWGSS
jgi:hypothetical protein